MAIVQDKYCGGLTNVRDAWHFGDHIQVELEISSSEISKLMQSINGCSLMNIYDKVRWRIPVEALVDFAAMRSEIDKLIYEKKRSMCENYSFPDWYARNMWSKTSVETSTKKVTIEDWGKHAFCIEHAYEQRFYVWLRVFNGKVEEVNKGGSTDDAFKVMYDKREFPHRERSFKTTLSYNDNNSWAHAVAGYYRNGYSEVGGEKWDIVEVVKR
jgi:hypothetical protein